jgi:hypothetical protein
MESAAISGQSREDIVELGKGISDIEYVYPVGGEREVESFPSIEGKKRYD